MCISFEVELHFHQNDTASRGRSEKGQGISERWDCRVRTLRRRGRKGRGGESKVVRLFKFTVSGLEGHKIKP